MRGEFKESSFIFLFSSSERGKKKDICTAVQVELRRQYPRPRSNTPGQPIKDKFVERPHGVPIKKSKQSIRCKIGSHGEKRFFLLRLGIELQPGFAGQLHLGP